MGLHGLPVICRELVAHGVDPGMPAALVQQGTTPMQRVFTGTLATLADIVAREQIKPPTLLIVGEVVKLQEKLSWYRTPAEPAAGATSPLAPEDIPAD
jgi:uroporphyrin-III C-methyltransferase/precorrin-2 dehydrogenase/sirohydrochlorin ferrochelatase